MDYSTTMFVCNMSASLMVIGLVFYIPFVVTKILDKTFETEVFSDVYKWTCLAVTVVCLLQMLLNKRDRD